MKETESIVFPSFAEGSVAEWDAFHQGLAANAFMLLGLHRTSAEAVFRVWAPHADAVFLCADFTDWSEHPIAMRRITRRGIWEARVDGATVLAGQNYKYLIRRGACAYWKADPYARCLQAPPESASVVPTVCRHEWQDSSWLRYRAGLGARGAEPLHIYRLDVGGWHRREDGHTTSYTALGEELLPYVKQMGFTHIELMPIAEHMNASGADPAPGGLYTPTARYGSGEELMRLVDMAHEAGIGVILDWNATCFAADGYGLADFEGAPLYEVYGYGDSGTESACLRRFDKRRGEVRSFLLSNALFWAIIYHVDGLCIDLSDVSCREAIRDGGEELAFWEELARQLRTRLPDVPLLARCDDVRDEAVCALAERVPDVIFLPKSSPIAHAEWRGADFARLRAFCVYATMPQGKLVWTMGEEIGQSPFAGDVCWSLLEEERNARLQLLLADLHRIYLRFPIPQSVVADLAAFDEERLLIQKRTNRQGEELIALVNPSSEHRAALSTDVLGKGRFELLLDTDCTRLGGRGATRLQADPNGSVRHVTQAPASVVLLCRRTGAASKASIAEMPNNII